MFFSNLSNKLADILSRSIIVDDPVGEEDLPNIVKLVRPDNWKDCPKGIQGHLIFPSGYKIPVLERPWKNNEREISCIDLGLYPVEYRISPLTKSLTKGKHEKTFEIMDVDGRDDIMIHIGNFVKNSLGCVLTGMSHGTTADGEPTVWSSAKSFDIFIEKMLTEEIDCIIICTESDS